MSHIKTYARLKPAQELYEDYEITNKKTFSLRVPELLRDYGSQAVRNRFPSISYDFQFDQVFDTTRTQEDVYAATAKDIVTGFLDGYNGTIFAYGQTGTGKTYTVEGGPLRYSDRGLAPRALAEIYKALEQRDDEDISLSISYLEIYQEVAYDLLSTTARTSSPVTVFPRVNVVEGSNGTCTIRNLSVHLAPSEDVASALLLQGQANRKVAETPVNQRSSRSHAVFTLYLTVKKQNSDIITRSKLHLVDLAGSERVAKTGVDGQQLTEAKSINLSLHYLETVIIALQADSAQNRPRSTSSGNSRGNISIGGRVSTSDGVRRHVPYRNSLLTMVLRDSLGGNCLTSMIATISLEVHNLGETLSTCRFAQRVACIANHARRNEEIDDKTLIQQLRRRIAELETQMACLRLSQTAENGGGDRREEDDTASKLTDEDKLSCAQVVQDYLAGQIADPVTAGITNPFKFRECLRILKRMVMSRYFQEKLAPPSQLSANGMSVSNSPSHSAGPRQRAVANAEHDRGTVEIHGNAQILRLDDTPPATGSSANTTASPALNGVMDTDELILNIQRLYAASRRDQRTHQQDNPTTPPKIAARIDTYKSPFERKREKEIRKLSRKLDMMKKSQSTQEQQLQALRMSTAFGELSSTESIIRNKIQVTREQIADQHAYRLHLRHTEANQDILQQEKMVEDQLIKREAKFQKKLEEVLQKKAELEAKAVQGEESEVKVDEEGQGHTRQLGEKRSLEEQFSQYKKRNGTLNTRQVFDMLKSEERKHTKVTHQAETEKKFLMTKQLALKEEATREKLRELKEMMRKSREEAFSGQDDQFNTFNTDMYIAHPPSNAWGEKDTHADDQEQQNLNHTFVVDRSEEENSNLAGLSLNDPESSMTRGDDGDKSLQKNAVEEVDMGVGNESRGVHHSQSAQQSSSNAPSRTSSKVELKWESAYSRPSTAHSVKSQEWVEPWLKSNAQGMSQTEGGESHFSKASPAQSPNVMREERRNGGTSSCSNSSGHSAEVRTVSSHPGQVLMQNTDDSQVPKENYAPTLTPSEYIHSMNNKDKFDATKMGLSSTTFESALSSMLNDDSKTVSYGFQYYDKYARESKPPTRKNASSRSPERRTTLTTSHRSSERHKTATTDLPVDHTGRFSSAWGPEAKSSSVAKRLALFLSDEKESKSTRPRKDTAISIKTTKSVSFLERLTQLQDEQMNGDIELEATSPRIQALQDTQRESTYMGRIQAEKERVAKIRQAREAAEAIQRAWRRHCRNSEVQ